MKQHEGEEMLIDFELFCREMDTKAEVPKIGPFKFSVILHIMFYGWLSALKTLDTSTGLRQV